MKNSVFLTKVKSDPVAYRRRQCYDGTIKIKEKSYMKIVKEFILREIAGECVLVPTGATSQEFNGMITISDTAKFIWENIEKVDSLEEMIRMVLDTYEIDEETARRDTIAFVGALVENGFIECTREDGIW